MTYLTNHNLSKSFRQIGVPLCDAQITSVRENVTAYRLRSRQIFLVRSEFVGQVLDLRCTVVMVGEICCFRNGEPFPNLL